LTDVLFDLLHARGIAYERCDHPAVFTTAQAEQLVPPLPGAKAKNLFLRDNHSSRRFLLVVPYAKRVDLARLAAGLSIRKLSFASADELQAVLGVTPGAVSLLALVNDAGHRAELLVDAGTWAADAIQCHPLVNTATVVLRHVDLQRFLEATGHVPVVLDVPERADPA
jgi:Ala-tRNA(Pro) deacylase